MIMRVRLKPKSSVVESAYYLVETDNKDVAERTARAQHKLDGYNDSKKRQAFCAPANVLMPIGMNKT